MNLMSLVEIRVNPKIPELHPGDTVKVSIKIVEGEKERLQQFQGTVIRIRGGAAGSFTVRRVSYGVGVERTFPKDSPQVEKVEILRHGKARRARLYYLRGLSAKASRIKEKRVEKGLAEAPAPEGEAPAAPTAEAPAPPQAEAPAPPATEAPAPPQSEAPEPPPASSEPK